VLIGWTIAKYFERFLNSFSLRLCSGCSKVYADDYYCEFCLERLKYSWLKQNYSRKYLDFDYQELEDILEENFYPRIYKATKYDDATKALIRHFKYRKPFLSEFWARFLYNYWTLHADWILSELSIGDIETYKSADLPLSKLDIYISAVPMYAGKQKKRGYNQAALLAEDFTEIFDLSQKYLAQTTQGLVQLELASVNFVPDLLVRVKDTPSLFNKAKYQRLEIVKDAFVFDASLLPETTNEQLVLLLDDISTSGASFMELGKVINRSGYSGDLVFLSLCG
jgi:predicted amidophosphoribosyltransferase